jgi:hypothetical protein
MDNLLFSFVDLGQNIKNGLTSSLGLLWFNILINFIGAVAILVKVVETQNKKRTKIVFFAVINYFLWITYFILNGDFTAAVVNGISFVQLLIFLQRGNKKWADSIIWLVVFILAQVVAGFFTWADPYSLFSITAGILSTIAYYVMNEKLYRYFFLALITFWIFNGIARGYVIALIHDVFAFVSILIAIIRYNFKKVDANKAEVDNANTNEG